MKISNILVKPIVTEKSMFNVNSGKYTFKVVKNVSKDAIYNEIKRLYGVDAIDIKTMIVPGKKRRVLKTRLYTKTPGWKKAVVKLKDGQHIDVFPKEK